MVLKRVILLSSIFCLILFSFSIIVEAATLCNRADINEDNIVDMEELVLFISQWKQSSQGYLLWEVMETMNLWKNGCTVSVCGNDICEGGETIENCPEDCLEKKVFASHMVWFPLFVFHNPESYPTMKDTPMHLSAMAPGCASTDDRDNNLCPPNQWNEADVIEDYKTEIIDAFEHGIDGFVFYGIGENFVQQPEKLGRMLTAAEEASAIIGENFEIMFAPDFSTEIPLDNFVSSLTNTLSIHKDHPNLYKENGVITINGYLADNYSVSEWEQVIQSLGSAGIDLAVIGHIYPNNNYHLGITTEGENKIRDYMTVLEGVSSFSPNFRQEHQEPVSNQLKQILDSDDKIYMPQVHPGYYSVFNDGRPNWYVDGDLSRFFRDNWELAISQDVDLINLVSWSDNFENHHISSSVNHNWVYLDITKWYSHIFKYGETPVVDETKLYLGHHGSVYTHYPIEIEVVGLVSDDHDQTSCDLSVTGSMDGFSKGDFSISMWYEFPVGAANSKWSLSKGDAWSPGSKGFGVAHWTESDPVTPELFLNDGTNRLDLGGGSINRGEWGHFVWTIDRATGLMKSYRNGAFQGELDISDLDDISNTTSPLVVGELLDSYFIGSMDELRIYNRVLDTAEIQALSNKQTDGSLGEGLVSLFSFEDDFSDSVGNDVVMNGDPTFVAGISGFALDFNGGDNLLTTFVPVTISDEHIVLENGLFVYEDSISGCGSDATIHLTCGSYEITEVVHVSDLYYEYKWHTDSELSVYDCNHGCGGIRLGENYAHIIDMSTIFKRII
ncbi:hypothetical protein K8R30_03850 [archaeon]|nr:hypothetical protein [archaeon]